QTTSLAGATAAVDKIMLLKEIKTLIKANEVNEGNIKIAITPGKSGKNNLLIYFTPHQYPTTEQFTTGVVVRLLDAERHNPNAKVMDVALRSETDKIKQSEEVYEILLVDRNGFITEGSRSNVFFIQGSTVITPPLEMVLPGVTRKHIIALCLNNGINLKEESVHFSVVPAFDALFLSGTSRKVLPICQVDKTGYPVNNQLMMQVSALFNAYVAGYIGAHQL
ncbi:MAG: aminotransferase class IV, partial [Lentimicrobium sp.]|nr:aminotransferase class IV [Lentimicrobium sp.]